MKTIVFIFSLVLLSTQMFAQTRYDARVKHNTAELVMPWTGGYNAPQFSNIDFNRDGVTDLVSFDRQGDILRTYVRLPASGRWIQQWSYESFFPDLADWLLIVDFDKDGIEDLFTSSSKTGVAGVIVYKGHYENDIWTFVQLTDRGKDYLQFPAGSDLANIYVSWDDIPSFIDVDNDGDIDILAFDPGGSHISYYQNQSVEMGWGTDSLRFVLADACWGKILENELSEEVFLSDNPDMCSDGNLQNEDPIIRRHAGSTIAALDIDFDGDKDAWLGDITSPHVVFLLNGLNAEEAWITAQEPSYPVDNVPIDIPYFVATYFVQLDDDPEPELLAAVNSRSLSEDIKSVWRYDDDFADGPLNYQLTEKGFFQNQMIDVGSQSKPAVADINGDGLKDLVIGGNHFDKATGMRTPSLWYYRNIGTSTEPYFQLSSEDYLSMSQFVSINTSDFAPAFGDLDGDGAIDLVVGDQNGNLFYYHNNAPAGDSMVFDSPVYPYMGIGVGVYATPQIADINGDGLSDLVIGERTGNADINGRCSNLNYFENQGSAGNPFFNPDVNVSPNTGCFGRVLFDLQIGLPQYSAPAIVRTDIGLILMAGGDPGNLHLYSDLVAGLSGPATLIDGDYGDLDFGNRSAPAMADLNDDGKYELIVGNQRGGLELFSTDIKVGFTSIVSPQEIKKPYSLHQSNHIVDVIWKNKEGETVLFDVYGRKIQNRISERQQRFDLNRVVPGIYFIQLRLDGKVWVEKVIKG